MKKLFISADLEGVSGVSSWEETRYGEQGYDAACRQLTREVAAACHAAQELGYTAASYRLCPTRVSLLCWGSPLKT